MYQQTKTHEVLESSHCRPDRNEFDSSERFFPTEPSYVGSPFANDFGNEYDGFFDGTKEHDIFLTELLDDALNDLSCEESASQKHSAIGSESYLSDQLCISSYAQPDTYWNGNGVYGNKNAEMSQLQVNN